MSLTFGGGPLSKRPPERVNYRLDGPDHKLLMQDFPRRIRARLGGENVFDTVQGVLVHETNRLPQIYIPEADIRMELLTRSDHTTADPYKGEATYWSIRVGDRTAENAAWAHPKPVAEASWIAGYIAFDWAAMDAWLDEDEEVFGHLRDPYHRVDARRSSRHVRVSAGDQVIAETDAPMVLSETGLPNRFYIPREDVRPGLLEESDTQTYCPYKGGSTYWSLRLGDELIPDVGWSYKDPLENALKAKDHISFLHDRLTVEPAP